MSHTKHVSPDRKPPASKLNDSSAPSIAELYQLQMVQRQMEKDCRKEEDDRKIAAEQERERRKEERDARREDRNDQMMQMMMLAMFGGRVNNTMHSEIDIQVNGLQPQSKKLRSANSIGGKAENDSSEKDMNGTGNK